MHYYKLRQILTQISKHMPIVSINIIPKYKIANVIIFQTDLYNKKKILKTFLKTKKSSRLRSCFQRQLHVILNNVKMIIMLN